MNYPILGLSCWIHIIPQKRKRLLVPETGFGKTTQKIN